MEIGSVAATTNEPPPAPDTMMGNDVFMTLLIAQLKSQNPLEPMNPEQFVSQLVQFNTLDQIIQIREAVETDPIPTSPLNPAADDAGVVPALPEQE